MGKLLDVRVGCRLAIAMAGMTLADGRRMAAPWFSAAGVGDDWDRFYDLLRRVRQRARALALPLLIPVVRKNYLGPDGPLTPAADDSPIRRFGPEVECAGYIATRPPVRPMESGCMVRTGSPPPSLLNIRCGA